MELKKNQRGGGAQVAARRGAVMAATTAGRSMSLSGWETQLPGSKGSQYLETKGRAGRAGETEVEKTRV